MFRDGSVVLSQLLRPFTHHLGSNLRRPTLPPRKEDVVVVVFVRGRDAVALGHVQARQAAGALERVGHVPGVHRSADEQHAEQGPGTPPDSGMHLFNFLLDF